jgi:hypothetical protein
VDTRIHVIILLEHVIEQQDLELEERAATIATIEQQLQVLLASIISLTELSSPIREVLLASFVAHFFSSQTFIFL